MTIRPIAFTGAMVSALLSGRKTQTRRVLQPQPGAGATHYRSGTGMHIWDWPGLGIGSDDGRELPRIPYIKGDLLYVREDHRAIMVTPCGKRARVSFDADGAIAAVEDWPERCRPPKAGVRRPPMFLPREFSRLTLKVTNVRVERVKQISEADAIAEGVSSTLKRYPDGGHMGVSARDNFHSLWDSINAPRGFGWDENPWVVAVSFEVIRQNVDRLRREHMEDTTNE